MFAVNWIHTLIQPVLNSNQKLKKETSLFNVGKIRTEVGLGDLEKYTFRKGVGSGDAVERSCGWEEEMREELRKDW